MVFFHAAKVGKKVVSSFSCSGFMLVNVKVLFHADLKKI